MSENTIKGTFNGSTVTFGYAIDKDKHFQKTQSLHQSLKIYSTATLQVKQSAVL